MKPEVSYPRIMAIVNVTDDSFYSASRTMERSGIASRVEKAIADGASVIDVGGYSSRPGASDIPVGEEWRRVDAGIAAVREVDPSVEISVDTFRSEIVRRACDRYGRITVNDISAGEADAGMIPAVAELGLTYIMMHMRGTPSTMQSQTGYADVVSEVKEYLLARAEYAVSAGVKRALLVRDMQDRISGTCRYLAQVDDIPPSRNNAGGVAHRYGGAQLGGVETGRVDIEGARRARGCVGGADV